MMSAKKKWPVVLFNVALLWSAWYMSGYGVMVGRTGNLGMNCEYLTARGLYDQSELAANRTGRDMPHVDDCSIVYGFDVKK